MPRRQTVEEEARREKLTRRRSSEQFAAGAEKEKKLRCILYKILLRSNVQYSRRRSVGLRAENRCSSVRPFVLTRCFLLLIPASVGRSVGSKTLDCERSTRHERRIIQWRGMPTKRTTSERTNERTDFIPTVFPHSPFRSTRNSITRMSSESSTIEVSIHI